jgi:hypothetical protein
VAILFDEILTKGVRAGQIPARESQARTWYRDQASTYKRINENKLMKGDADRLTARPLIGQMYLYQYEAKHAKTLPYYDRLPLVFPFRKVKGGFYGINLHYLPLAYRAKLMDALYDISSNNRYDETTKIKLSYDILNNASKFRYFKPCVKRYLTSQLRSRFMYIYPSEWDIALFLPLERFQGASKSQVFAESRRSLR